MVFQGSSTQKLVLLAPRTSTDKMARALRHKIRRTKPLGANIARGVQNIMLGMALATRGRLGRRWGKEAEKLLAGSTERPNCLIFLCYCLASLSSKRTIVIRHVM